MNELLEIQKEERITYLEAQRKRTDEIIAGNKRKHKVKAVIDAVFGTFILSSFVGVHAFALYNAIKIVSNWF